MKWNLSQIFEKGIIQNASSILMKHLGTIETQWKQLKKWNLNFDEMEPFSNLWNRDHTKCFNAFLWNMLEQLKPNETISKGSYPCLIGKYWNLGNYWQTKETLISMKWNLSQTNMLEHWLNNNRTLNWNYCQTNQTFI